MRFIVAVSAGTDDPTRASLGMIAAKVAKDQGHDVTVWLQGEAVHIARQSVYDKIVGHNMPPMKNMVDALVEAQVPFLVCEACGRGRGIAESDLLPNARYAGMGDYVRAVAEFDRSMSF
ncbi:MAG: DsrE family protein [Thioalkalivibrionaceae bacterium]